MDAQRPTEIRAWHLLRKVLIYVRQSTGEQVERHQGSAEYQRNLIELALAWGWSREAIEIIDEDLGLSGAATEHRPGYKRMVEEIRAGLVGIILLSDFSRAGRNAVEWLRLLEECRRYKVLLAIDGRVYDLADTHELFMTQLNALLGEHDNRIRRGHLERGRLAKVRAGKTVTQPPAGYVRLPDGRWIKDSDPAVRDGIDAVIRAFIEGRSLRAAVLILKASGARIPRKKVGCPVHLIEPTVPAVQRILKNRAYVGDYVLGTRRADPRRGRDSRGRLRLRQGDRCELTVCPSNHEPYMTRETWDEIQAVLKENRWNGARPGGLGRGGALLQAMIRCGLHRGRRMTAPYKSRRRDGIVPHVYRCIGVKARPN